MTRRGTTRADFTRTLDATRYYMRARWSAGASLAITGQHQYVLTESGDRLELTAWFAPTRIVSEPDSAAAVETASRDHWQQYWSTGGAIGSLW